MDESEEEHTQTLHVPTPLIHSLRLSIKLDCNVFFKMENIQPTGSAKIRGVGYFCYKTIETRGNEIQLICGVGLNTVLAVAYSARQLGVTAILVMPKSLDNALYEIVRLEGAQLIIYGNDWEAADIHARKLIKRNGVYVPSADHSDIWKGYSSIVHELQTQLESVPPAAIVCPVGAGGLLNGIITGLQEIGWKEVPVIAVETHGSNAFQASVIAGRLVSLPHLSTIATSLSAKSVSPKSLELSLVHPVVPFAVSDAMAADAARLFAEENKVIVEAASGAALSVCYTHIIKDILPSLSTEGVVVVIVTGGSDISLTRLDEYSKKYTNPPVIVKSGSEVFLKIDNKLTHIPHLEITGPMGISHEDTKLYSDK